MTFFVKRDWDEFVYTSRVTLQKKFIHYYTDFKLFVTDEIKFNCKKKLDYFCAPLKFRGIIWRSTQSINDIIMLIRHLTISA